MYRHLLVPVEDSALSAANVACATRLAKDLGARITFFHATPDFAATSEGALLRSIEPAAFEVGQVGERHLVLSKAMVAARYAGVDCNGLAGSSDRPAEAIVSAASQQGCDLIVMASRGARGVAAWMQGSQTQKVLKTSPVALLVTRVEANEPLLPREQALAVIQDEHRSLAVVMTAMKQLGALAGDGSLTAHDLIALKAMIRYLREFPLRLHHPKEELYLHPMLRQRHPPLQSVLAEIELQHRREPELVTAVESGIDAWAATAASAGSRLAEAIDALASAVLEHIGLEERTILPLATEHLTDDDWESAAAGFSSHHNPQFAGMPAEELRQLFVRIAGFADEATRSVR